MVTPSQAARAAGNTGPRAATTSRPEPQPQPIPERESADALQHLLGVLQSLVTSSSGADEFGFDAGLTDGVLVPVLRPLYRSWFRVTASGLGNIPDEGSALVVANHAGAIAVDALMTQVAIHDDHPAHRHLRSLTADLVFRIPLLSDLAGRGGMVRASVPNAERLLQRGELVGVWPEGFKGIGKPFSKRYQLQRFGRGGFVAVALRTGAPLIPTAIVGSEEIYPIIGDATWLARLFDLPYFPITPTFPMLGPMGMIPLPSKWTIAFGEPIQTAGYGPRAAEDPEVVFALADEVRDRIQQMLVAMLVQRTSVFS